MNNIFLLGKYYNKIDDEKYNFLINRANEYEKNADLFINSIYDNKNSKIVQYNLWKQNIKYIEEAKQKPLYEFNINEIRQLLESIPSIKYSVKHSVYSYCNLYFEFCINRGLISINPIQGLNKDDVLILNKKATKINLISDKDFYNLLIKLENNCEVKDFISLVLAKNGIIGEKLSEMRSLKYSDIIGNRICISNKEIILNDADINWINKAYNNNEYVINNNNGLAVTENWIYKRLYKCFKEADAKRVTFNTVLNSSKIKMLLNKRRQRILNTNDVLDVVRYYNPNSCRSNYTTLKKLYETVTNDKVQSALKTTKELADTNSNETVDSILKDLKWN